MQSSGAQMDKSILEAGKLNELRKLLTGLTQEELQKLQQLLGDPHEFAEEISQLLPYAIRKLMEKGEVDLQQLLPYVEEAMHQSIRNNPKRLADILFPVMGPAIRKAVSEDMKRLIASVNASIESGISPKTIKWRLQALTSRRSYAEIVLANSYLYHVSHVFLIHRETGLLLHEAVAEESKPLEADLIAAMLTAIRDFVHDSLKTADGVSLDEIQVGRLKILIEQGPHAVVAAIIEGQQPADYRVTLMETIEAVHYNHSHDLENFTGDTQVFEHTAKFLQQCIIRQKKAKAAKPPYALLALLIVVVGLTGWWLWTGFQNKQHFENLVVEMEATPGYHLTNATIGHSTLVIRGLKDPLALNHSRFASWKTVDTNQVTLNFEGFVSTDDGMLELRARNLLQPPTGVELVVRSGKLILSGTSSKEWQQFAEENYTSVYGIHAIDTTALNANVVDLRWIVPAIEHHVFHFDINIVRLDSLQQLKFDSLVQAAIHLEEYNKLYNKAMAIHVRSYTNRNGNAQANERVAGERAAQFMALLVSAGVKQDLLKSQILFAEELSEDVSLRSVHFSVFDQKPVGND